MAAEEFEHPIERFCDTHEHNDDNKLMHGAITAQELGTKQKEEKTEKCEPFKEFDLGGEGKKGN